MVAVAGDLLSFPSISATLSLTGKRWHLPEECAAEHLLEHLSQRRGMTAVSMQSYDGCIFPEAAKAAKRITEACARGERIGIVGDYDCDGVTSAALLLRMLRRRGSEPVVRLPHRVHDGYGLKERHVDEMHAADVTLLLVADTGISAHKAVVHARERGIDVVIFDHHEALNGPPPVFAVLHPALTDGFPQPFPCAAGVVFHFLRALEGGAWEGRSTDAALAAIGTVADLVPLTGANRALVQEGLRAFNMLQSGPLREMAQRARCTGPVRSTDIAFRIAPRINAAGRMDDPSIALRALMEGGSAIDDLEMLNARRQADTMTAVDVALGTLRGDDLPPFLTTASAQVTPGIIGLVAGKLTERYGRPSMAVCVGPDECTASLRSTRHYSIIDGLTRCSALLTSFGGHAQAAGCTFPSSNLEALTQALIADVALSVAADDLVPSLTFDASIAPQHITLPLVRSLAALEPFGQGNPEPQFLLRNVQLAAARVVGTDGQHLQATVGGTAVIGFGLGSLLPHASAPLDLACRLSINAWNGREEAQLQIVDARKT